jgi:hypothetical protein
VLTEWKERETVYKRRRQMQMDDHGGVVPAYATLVPGVDDEVDDGVPGRRTRTGKRTIAERPGRQPAGQRMAGPMAPTVEAPDAVSDGPATQEIDPDHDQELAELSAEPSSEPVDDEAARQAEERREKRRRRQQNRKHGRR